uniref:Uncharacterized protein n=1 Tax=Timema bartmani TaxID=61472 RepID=A0A7R9ERZ6_9NEOP|nr:unnamed protein product [Timema bartmani]
MTSALANYATEAAILILKDSSSPKERSPFNLDADIASLVFVGAKMDQARRRELEDTEPTMSYTRTHKFRSTRIASYGQQCDLPQSQSGSSKIQISVTKKTSVEVKVSKTSSQQEALNKPKLQYAASSNDEISKPYSEWDLRSSKGEQSKLKSGPESAKSMLESKRLPPSRAALEPIARRSAAEEVALGVKDRHYYRAHFDRFLDERKKARARFLSGLGPNYQDVEAYVRKDDPKLGYDDRYVQVLWGLRYLIAIGSNT